MIYLLLHVIFGSAFTLLLKWSQNRRLDTISIGMVNYICAAVCVLPWIAQQESPQFETYAMLTGGSMGICYFIAYFFVIYSIRVVGASSTMVVIVLSLIVPITFAVILWDERPTVLQTVGIGLALCSLSLIGRKPASKESEEPKKEESKDLVESSPKLWLVIFVLVTFFCLCGFNRLAQEAFKHLSQPEQRPTYLLTAFVCASVPSISVLLYRFRRMSKVELLTGVALGASNVLGTLFVLQSLEFFPGYIVFPVTSAGALLLTTMVATMALQERLGKLTYVGIGVAVIALFCLSPWSERQSIEEESRERNRVPASRVIKV